MIRSILVPLDGSPFSEHALPLARSIAQRSGAAVQLLHVVPEQTEDYLEGMPFFDGPPLGKQRIERHRVYLDGLAQRLRQLAPIPVVAEVWEGSIVPIITATALRIGADLVVMTTHGRGPFQRWWLGSVADEMLRSPGPPMLLVRPNDGAVDWTAQPAFQHVLLPLDGSDFAEQIIEPATDLGGLMLADYTVLRVVVPTAAQWSLAEGGTVGEMTCSLFEQMAEQTEGRRRGATAYLELVADRLRARSLDVTTRVVVHTQPAGAILEAARPPIDLIALQSHCRHGLSRLFVGSVADKIVRGVDVPVLVHRPAGR